eukprot:PhM_4_TR5250/c0_g1_i2/m.41945
MFSTKRNNTLLLRVCVVVALLMFIASKLLLGRFDHHNTNNETNEIKEVVISDDSSLQLPPAATPRKEENNYHHIKNNNNNNEPDPSCVRLPFALPISSLERELQRIYDLSLDVAKELNVTIWPTDGALLGLIRNGRISTDADLDFQIHATYDTCAKVLNSLRSVFERLGGTGRVHYFKVATTRGPKGNKIGRYAMVRMKGKFGHDTGADFNCVFTDDPEGPKFYTHRGKLTLIPKQVFPLKKCLFYDTRAVPCPGDGYAVLETLKPRYDGCMVFPHCVGDFKHPTKRCGTPHPVMPIDMFVKQTQELHRCGFVSLAEHWTSEPKCRGFEKATSPARKCEHVNAGEVCFLQPYDG